MVLVAFLKWQAKVEFQIANCPQAEREEEERILQKLCRAKTAKSIGNSEKQANPLYSLSALCSLSLFLFLSIPATQVVTESLVCALRTSPRRGLSASFGEFLHILFHKFN